MLLGRNITFGFGNVTGEFRNDLPRSPEGQALIGDHRNDENLIVARTHLAFLKFHNTVVDLLAAQGVEGRALFQEARQIVTWHYQWIVLHDYLDRLAGPGAAERILHDGRKFYRFKKMPYMPVEFSGAAYRLGHTMVRQDYDYNRVFPNATFDLLFGFTGLPGRILGGLPPEPPPAAPLPAPHLPSDRRSSTGAGSTRSRQATARRPRAGSIRCWPRNCTACPAVAATWPSAIFGAGCG
ncbi:peroxidase family protein, partial [Rhodovulum sp.]|uniref:peroxidase family protein n=1 Tax=Rhodovulum sp. TaxID=34009 RepID=UPI0032E3B307